MNKSNFYFIVSLFFVFTFATSCILNNPEKIVENSYSAANDGKYAKILPYIVPDSIEAFNSKEQEQFEKLMKEVMPEVPVYSSYTVENVDENPDSLGYLNFTVNTAFNDGLTYTEKGQLYDDNGTWKILLKPEDKDKNTVGYSVKDNSKPSGELLRNLEYAYDIVLSSRGIPEFQLKAAQHYNDSVFVKQDLNKYITLLTAAAEKNYPEAMNELGDAYEDGYGVTKNETKAFELYQKAADKGYVRAMVNLAQYYEEGTGTIKNEVEGVKWYQKAADLGDLTAMNNLSVMYSHGRGVVKDPQKAFDLMKKAADLGDDGAMYNLSFYYWNGDAPVTKDISEALKWKEKSAETGCPWALNDLGNIYYFGNQVPQDYDKAYYWFNKNIEFSKMKDDNGAYGGAKDYLANSHYYLGECFELGRGVSKDLRKAKEHYLKAAALGKKEGEIKAKRL